MHASGSSGQRPESDSPAAGNLDDPHHQGHAAPEHVDGIGWRALMATTYLASVAQTTIARALYEINEHVALSSSGLCRTCQIEGPCVRRSAAERTLRSYNLLPQRQPGATRPELIGLRRISPSTVSATGAPVPRC